MSPEEIAAIHPRLYHITRPQALPGIRKHGLLPASSLMSLFDVPFGQRRLLETRRRKTDVTLRHSAIGEATLTNNAPLDETRLLHCLDDGLQPADWISMLNQRVFFWVDEKQVDTHLRACLRDSEKRIVLVLDTLGLALRYHEQIDFSPINAGSTMRSAARRGLSTFAPAHQHAYREWQALRGRRDRVKEVTVRADIRDVDAHVLGYYPFPHLDPDFGAYASASARSLGFLRRAVAVRPR